MRNPVPDLLDELRRECADSDGGEVLATIPELADADPDRFGIALCTIDGTVYGTGDDDHRFTIQSISKPFAYGLALEDRGRKAVLRRVGVEPTGEAHRGVDRRTEACTHAAAGLACRSATLRERDSDE